MQSLSQSPTDADFVQDPYAFYRRARRECGSLFHWADYDLPCALSYAGVWAILRDRRLGRQPPETERQGRPPHQDAFWAVEDHSMLELEAPRHTRLRKLVLRAFTSRQVAAMAPVIQATAHDLIERIEGDRFDIISSFAQQLPIIVIARLLGVPQDRSAEMVAWSHAMVSMYQAGRTHAQEVAAASAAAAFSAFLQDYIAFRRDRPADDLLTALIAAEQQGDRLSAAELIATCILLLNAGHEATVHTLGNGVKALLGDRTMSKIGSMQITDAVVEEILRYDPPLHMFTRYVYQDVAFGLHTLPAGSRVACLLAAGNRDPQRWDRAEVFDPARPVQTHLSLGAGAHFCIGAPLARLELKIGLQVLFDRCPRLAIAEPPVFSDTYHFHGLQALWVNR